jgi:fatty acid desaturase
MKHVNNHRFDSKIRSKIRGLHQLDNYHGPLELAKHWIFIFLCIFATEAAIAYLHPYMATVIYAISIVQIGGRMRSLADILHQSAHHSLAKNRKLNDFLGRYIAGLPIIQSLTLYTSTHVKYHHGKYGDPEQDVDYIELIDKGLYGDNMSPFRVLTFILAIPSLKNSISYLHYMYVNRVISDKLTLSARAARLAAIVTISLVIMWSGYWMEFLLYWCIPFFTTYVWIGSFCELIEHYPYMETAKPRLDVLLGRNRIVSKWFNLFLGLEENEGYHLVHHLFPKLPSHNLKKAHSFLLADKIYKENCSAKYSFSMLIYELMESTCPDGGSKDINRKGLWSNNLS